MTKIYFCAKKKYEHCLDSYERGVEMASVVNREPRKFRTTLAVEPKELVEVLTAISQITGERADYFTVWTSSRFEGLWLVSFDEVADRPDLLEALKQKGLLT